MRRVVMALLATMLGSGLLIGLKSRPVTNLAAPVAEAPVEPGQADAAVAAGGPAGQPGPGGSASASPASAGGATTTAAASTAPTTKPSTAARPAAAP